MNGANGADMAQSESSNALRALVAKRGATSRLYWLLDQSALPAAEWLTRWIGRAEWLDLLSGPSERHLNGASPIIVRADGDAPAADLHRVDALQRVGRFANAISLIRWSGSIAGLQALLQRRSRIDLPGSFEAVLRFFDTRTLPLLPRLLSPDQFAAFTDGIEQWFYVDRRGGLQGLPMVETHRPATAPATTRLCLDEAQEARLIDDGLTDAVIDFFLTQQHPALLERTPPAQFDCIDPLVRAARSAGFGEWAEAVAFVGTALAEGADFAEREPWRLRLIDYQQKRCSLEEAFA